MSAHRLAQDYSRAANAGMFRATDPGDEGTLVCANKMPMDWAIITAGVETRTLATPLSDGQTIFIVLDEDGGNCTLTVSSPFDQTGNNTIEFGDAGDFIALHSVKVGSNYRWRILGSDGVALSTV